ncbi:hypothetical protein ACP4OV_013664 [Aristida adscensionis]
MAMHLRAFGSVLTRRLSPRGTIPGTKAQVLPPAAVGRLPSARTLHTLRDVVSGHGVLGAGAVATSVGLLGLLYLFKSYTADQTRKHRWSTLRETKEYLEAVQRDRGGPEEEITTAGETELSVLIAAAEERRRRARLGFTARQGEKEKEANDG